MMNTGGGLLRDTTDVLEQIGVFVVNQSGQIASVLSRLVRYSLRMSK